MNSEFDRLGPLFEFLANAGQITLYLWAILSGLFLLGAIVFTRLWPDRASRYLDWIRELYGNTSILDRFSAVEAFPDPTTWASRQDEFLRQHTGTLYAITRSSPFAHENDTYKGRLELLKQKLNDNEIDNADYIISLKQMRTLCEDGRWKWSRYVARLDSLLENLELDKPTTISPDRLRIAISPHGFTYGVQMYKPAMAKSGGFLIFYIEQDDGKYGPSFVVKNHNNIIKQQTQYFRDWFNTLSGQMVSSYRSKLKENPDFITNADTNNVLLRKAALHIIRTEIEFARTRVGRGG